MKIGANYLGNGQCEFTVWAPFLKKLELKLLSPVEKLIQMQYNPFGYWYVFVEGISPNADYLYVLDGERERPDPCSYYQPFGVHRASRLVDHNIFAWEDSGWGGVPLSDMIVYELHVGTFTPEGTFASIIPRLKELKKLGVTAIEIMPIAQFPGERNWGYDGVYPFAVQNSYGGIQEFKRLVNECHRYGLSVILDVVYNHLGPEGNYLWDFGPYFTDQYKTPWGQAINFDGAYSDGVRNYFIENALYWYQNFHVDVLRLDAIHAICDRSAKTFLQELVEKVKEISTREKRELYLIAESDLNGTKIITPSEKGGYGIHAQWSDDLHHSLHVLLTGEKKGYYADFGKISQLSIALREGFVYSGQYSEYRKRRHGNSSQHIPGKQLLVCSQNHDQVGNRMLGERLCHLVSPEAVKLSAGIILLTPYLPMLFMGEEYAETSPFLYFVSHQDENLVSAVREGRKKEFESFHFQKEPPDPQSLETFFKSKLHWEKREEGQHALLLNFYQTLIQLRKKHPALAIVDKSHLEVGEYGQLVWMLRWQKQEKILCLFYFNHESLYARLDMFDGMWKKILDSFDTNWGGSGSQLPLYFDSVLEVELQPYHLVVYVQQK